MLYSPLCFPINPCRVPDHQYLSRESLAGSDTDQISSPSSLAPASPCNKITPSKFFTPPNLRCSSWLQGEQRRQDLQCKEKHSSPPIMTATAARRAFKSVCIHDGRKSRMASVLMSLVPSLTEVGASLGPHYAGEKKRFIQRITHLPLLYSITGRSRG